MDAPTRRTPKDERLGIRVSAADKATLEKVSRSMRMSTSEFVVREAVASAEEILAERTRFVLPQEQWDAFVARLDEPAREIPALVRALSRPSPFDE